MPTNLDFFATRGRIWDQVTNAAVVDASVKFGIHAMARSLMIKARAANTANVEIQFPAVDRTTAPGVGSSLGQRIVDTWITATELAPGDEYEFKTEQPCIDLFAGIAMQSSAINCYLDIWYVEGP